MSGAEMLALAGTHGLTVADLLQLLAHFCVLSLLAVGGAITTAPDMQRWLVGQQGWLSDAQFGASVALAQAAPGPNILFVALVGWNAAGLAGLLATMAGIMGPSSLLAWGVGRWGQRNAQALPLRAFTTGLVPLTIGLLCATAWILVQPSRASLQQAAGAAALMALTVVLMRRTRWTPLVPIAVGALVGGAGFA